MIEGWIVGELKGRAEADGREADFHPLFSHDASIWL